MGGKRRQRSIKKMGGIGRNISKRQTYPRGVDKNSHIYLEHEGNSSSLDSMPDWYPVRLSVSPAGKYVSKASRYSCSGDSMGRCRRGVKCPLE